MRDEELVHELLADGRISSRGIEQWNDAAGLMAALDAIGRAGASAVVKIDGARSDGAVYTVAVSGGSLGEDYFRQDGSDLAALLRAAVEFYKSAA